MLGPDIFISYAREDENVARMFAGAFTREGFHVWWDAAIHSGETFDEVIEKELRAARAVVVLWSPRSVGSRWVRAEATLADRNKTLAPVVIEACNRPIIFELTHTVDLSHWNGDIRDGAWQVYLQDVRRLVESGREAAAKKAGEAPPPPLSAGSRPQHSASAPPPQPAGETLDNSKMDSLISMLSSLQQSMQNPGQSAAPQPEAKAPEPAPPPPPPPEDLDDDDSDATQFYTASDQYKFLEGDEFHCLEIVNADGEVLQRYPIGPLGIKIGRTAPADVVLADGKVSRSHCLLELKDDELFVSDLNSTNGTFVDGKRVTGAALVPLGSVLMVGSFELVHQLRKRSEV